jgi:hypothetical protein
VWVNNCWQNSNAIIVQIGTGGSIGSDSGGGCDMPGTTVDFTAFVFTTFINLYPPLSCWRGHTTTRLSIFTVFL